MIDWHLDPIRSLPSSLAPPSADLSVRFDVMQPLEFANWCQALQHRSPDQTRMLVYLSAGYTYEHNIMSSHLERYRKARTAHAHYASLAAGCVARMLRLIDAARKIEGKQDGPKDPDELPL